MSNATSRPLSPHLSIYKMKASMVMSGMHRITGMGLTVGLVLLTWWLVAAGAGPDYFAFVQGLLRTWIGQLALLGWTFCLFYHFGTGIRHLVFDIGKCLTKEGINRSGWTVVVFAAAATGLTWVIGYVALGVK